jgi:protein SCO1/2
VDQLLLYCYHYDPATGTYGAAIMKIMRIAGVATVLANRRDVCFSKGRNRTAE